MIFVSGEEIRASMDFSYLMDAFEAAHRHPAADSEDVLLGSTEKFYFVRSASAAAHGGAMGSKLVTSIADNPARRGLPAVQAVFVLFDGDSGKIKAVLDGTEITYWKTAGDSALAARHVARADAKRFLMVGAGAMAPWLIRAHRTARPSITEVVIWNRTRGRADQLAATMADELAAAGCACSVVTDLQGAVSEADIICCATRASEPVVFGAWLRPGQHVDLVGGFSPSTRESDDECMRRGRVFVDSRKSARDVADIIAPMKSGALAADGIAGDHYELASGAVTGRRDDHDITVFKNAGGGHLDLMTAEAILARLSA